MGNESAKNVDIILNPKYGYVLYHKFYGVYLGKGGFGKDQRDLLSEGVPIWSNKNASNFDVDAKAPVFKDKITALRGLVTVIHDIRDVSHYTLLKVEIDLRGGYASMKSLLKSGVRNWKQ